MVVAKVLSRVYADMLLYSQSIVYYEHCVSVCRELKDKRLEGEYLEILSSLYLSLNTERWSSASPSPSLSLLHRFISPSFPHNTFGLCSAGRLVNLWTTPSRA